MYILTTLEFPKHNHDFHLLTTRVNAKYYYYYNHGSLLSFSAFSIQLLIILTADSAFPFHFGYRGEDVTCSSWQAVVNSRNSWLTIWELLWVARQSGIPWGLNCPFKNRITGCGIWLVSDFDQVHLVVNKSNVVLVSASEEVCCNTTPRSVGDFVCL